ncbi:unnamed protein product [Absidia cylindrospora]
MVNLQGLDVCVNLKNGDVIYGIVTDMDGEDGSISLEKVERCFTSGRKSNYPFMKIPGHIILNYNPKTATETPRQQQQQQPSAHVSQPSSTSDFNAPAPAPASEATGAPTIPSLDNQASPQKSTFVDPAIISITSEKKLVTEKRTKKQQHSPGSTKSSKAKKESQHTATGGDTNDTPTMKTNKTTKAKSKRGNKAKQAQQQQQPSGDAQEDGEVNKSVKSPAAAKSSPAKTRNAHKQPSKKQQQRQEQQEQQLDQEQQSPQQQKQQKQQKPQSQSQPPRQHVMPHFGSQTSSRKVVETVESYDFDEFATTPGKSNGYENKQPRFTGEQKDQQVPVSTSALQYAMPEPKKTSQLHKPDDAVNQAATQSLLSSLNMVSSFPPSTGPGASHESSSLASPGSSHSYTSPIQSTHDTTFALNMPFPMPRPTVYTGDPFQTTTTTTTTNGEKGTTPTKTMVPLLDDGSPATNVNAHDSTGSATTSITSPTSSSAAQKTYVLQPEPPTEKLQKPMEDEDSEPILTKKKDNHANSYDGPIIRSVATGAACPVLSVELLSRLIQITKSEAGLNESMITENAAHATTSITFKMIGGQRRVQQQNHNDAPIVVILAGNHSVGTYGIATARHLANRGIQVVVLLVSLELDPQMKEQKRCAQFAGVTFVDSVDGKKMGTG